MYERNSASIVVDAEGRRRLENTPRLNQQHAETRQRNNEFILLLLSLASYFGLKDSRGEEVK